MPTLVLIGVGGSHSALDVRSGDSVMQAAVDQNVDGILGDCGGKLVCGTCHVFVDDGPWVEASAIADDEDDMLDYTATPRRPGSRLSCQLIVGAQHEGTVLRLPETQEL